MTEHELTNAQRANRQTYEYLVQRCGQLLQENDAMREIVQTVATQDTIAHEGDAGDDYRCVFCGSTEFDWRRYEAQNLPIQEKIGTEFRFIQHEFDCPVTKARALLAQ